MPEATQKLFEFKVRRIRRKFKYSHVMLNGPKSAGLFLVAVTKELDREHFYSVHIDVRGHVIGYETIAIGGLAGVAVHPREVFRGALLTGAHAIIVAHNHPSGSLEATKLDIDLTLRLEEAGRLIGIEVLDSLIIGNEETRSLIDVLRDVHRNEEAG